MRVVDQGLIQSTLTNIKKLFKGHELPRGMPALDLVTRLLLLAKVLTTRFPLAAAETQDLLELDDPFKRLSLVNRCLERAIAETEREALEVALWLLDNEKDEALRARASDRLDDLFGRRCARAHVENVLLSRPLRVSQMASLPSAIELVSRDRFGRERRPARELEAISKSYALLRRFEPLQSVIGNLCRAFDALPMHLFGEDESDRERVREVLVRGGAFSALAIVEEDPSSVASAVAALLSRDAPSLSLSTGTTFCEIITAWTEPLLEAARRKGVPPPMAASDASRWEEGFLADELNAINQAYDEEPVVVRASLTRANLYRAGRMYDDALSDYDAILRDKPSDLDARFGRAETHKEMGRLDDALGDYDEVLAKDPHRIEARRQRAEVLQRQWRLEDSLREYDDVLVATAEVALPGGERGTVLETPWEQFCRLRAAHLTGHARAVVLTALGRLEEALRAYEALPTEGPQSGFGRARILARLGRWDDALAALPDPPRDWRNYHARAMILFRSGDLDTAEAIFKLGSRYLFTPQRDQFRMALAIVRLRSGDAGGVPSLLEGVAASAYLPLVQALWTHAHILRGEAVRAADSLARIPSAGPPILLAIREELSRGSPTHLSPGLGQLEIDLLDQTTFEQESWD